jgi:pyrroline-5-carboxylate reductase
MITWCKSEAVGEELAEKFTLSLSAAGRLDMIPEAQIDAASAIAGCGPAFVYMFADALAKGGAECGLPYDKAAEYAAQMMLGAARMLQNDSRTPEQLRIAVCSPGGSTIQGVQVLQANNMEQTVQDAVKASFERNKQLGKQ